MIKKHSANVKRFVAFKVTRIMGVYPVICLKDARDRRDEAKKQLAKVVQRLSVSLRSISIVNLTHLRQLPVNGVNLRA